jgi:protein SCO1/2
MDQVLLFCFHYDPQTQRYAPAAVRIMKAGGLATVLLVGGLLAVYWRREARQPKAGKSEAAS